MNYTVRTVSLIQSGRVLDEYYVGNSRKEASQTVEDLQKKEFTRIQLIDRKDDKVFQFDFNNRFGYKLKILPYENN